MKIRSTIILFSYFVLFISDDVYNGRIISRQKKKIFLWLDNKLFFSADSSTSKLNNEDSNNNYQIRSVKAVKSTKSRIIPSISLATMEEDQDYDECEY